MAGRTLADFTAPYEGELLLFASQFADGNRIKNAKYAHCTFAHISFKGVELTNSSFLNCVFVGCYFRDAMFSASHFVGCRFIDCNFKDVKLRASDFRYAQFRGCYLPSPELLLSAPGEPNLQMTLFAELSRAADSLGDQGEAREYKLASIRATNAHLRAAVKAKNSWYEAHYPLGRRIDAMGTLGWHTLNRVLWKHGESAWRLLIIATVVALVLFPLAFKVAVDLPFGEAVWLSLSNFLSLDRLSSAQTTTTTARILSTLEGLSGVLFAGMYVTLLLKALLRR
ncbi:pentapeptide repeat-containing protein [Kribbella sp. NPDC049584]|uniref:pentapeptide repeat-containing protein n=1 Tax=Kribbella sp. NPDC049584 TaxID=3154833 RepID=UPI0034456B0B